MNAFYEYFFRHQNKCGTLGFYIQENYDPDFSYSIMRTLLSSEFYKGTYRGFPYCPAYLTEEEWNRLQKIQKKNIKTTPSGRIYLFAGMIHCPVCGQLLCGTGCSSIINRKTREKRTYCYYRCNKAAIDHKCPYKHRLSQNLVENYLLNNLEDGMKKYKIKCERIEKEKEKQKKKQSPDKLKRKLDRLNFLFQKDRINWDYYNKEYSRVESELNELQAALPEPTPNYSYC